MTGQTSGQDAITGGRCLCGEVSYQASGPAGAMWYCHCPDCRKSSGVGFGTWIEAPGVRWLSGEERVVRYASTPALTRAFCARCGTVLPAQRAGEGRVLLPAGGLESVGDLRPCGHASAAERLPWLPTIDEHLPARRDACGSATTAATARAPIAPPAQPLDAAVRGSCLCGAIAYEVTRPLAATRVCHCSRCRRRSGSSWFVGLTCRSDTLRFLRGDGAITTWHMPGTRFYTMSFCGLCGAAAPAVLSRAAFLSAGCLDDDPGVRVLCHIFYGSRAPWVNVPDGLPRFEEFTPPDYNWQAARPAPSGSRSR